MSGPNEHARLRAQYVRVALAGNAVCVRSGLAFPAVGEPCPICYRPMGKNYSAGLGYCGLDVSHDDDSGIPGQRTVIEGGEFACLNRSRGGREGARARNRKRVILRAWSRSWLPDGFLEDLD